MDAIKAHDRNKYQVIDYLFFCVKVVVFVVIWPAVIYTDSFAVFAAIGIDMTKTATG